MHTTSDDPRRYRTQDEENAWLQRDPLTRFRQYLMDKGLLDANKVQDVEDQVKAEIQAGVERFEQQAAEYTDPMQIFDHHYAELPPHLIEQRAELLRELAADRGGGCGCLSLPWCRR